MAFLLFIPLVLLFIRAYVSMVRGRYSGRIVVPWKKVWGTTGRVGTLPPRLPPQLIFSIAAAFFIIALARPQTSFNKIKKNVEGIDIMLVLDLSASMRIEDFRDQNRLETAKPIIRDFIAGRPTDKIGFQVFSGEAVTLVPPTLDHTVLTQALRGAEIGDLKDGTAIGDALATAVGRMKESLAKSRVIILLTDGDSNVGTVDPLTAGELAKGFGIKVYTIAIGREGRVAMPFVQKDIFGRQVKTYQYFDSSINPELLRQIASLTGGKFYRVEDDADVLRGVFQDIDKLERVRIETSEQVKYNEQFMNYVWVGVFFFVLAFSMQHFFWRVYP
jgi:Ca-activated chloride channel family protein